MRGTPGLQASTLPGMGIIPAYAGNTFPWSNCRCLGRDHPRVCGEHNVFRPDVEKPGGSSPRMRGTRCESVRIPRGLGIIPAYAGNTAPWQNTDCRCGDHPRVCGEHCRKRTMTPIRPGSSPRMRGTLSALIVDRHHGGIIPAYAGNTRRIPRCLPATWDHPRVCGEHHALGTALRARLQDHPRVCGEHHRQSLAATGGRGSSPRMRGTH